MAKKEEARKSPAWLGAVSGIVLLLAIGAIVWQLTRPPVGMAWNSVEEVGAIRLADALASAMSNTGNVVIIDRGTPSPLAETAQTYLNEKGLNATVKDMDQLMSGVNSDMPRYQYQNTLKKKLSSAIGSAQGVMLLVSLPAGVSTENLSKDATFATWSGWTRQAAKQMERGKLVAIVLEREGINSIDGNDKRSAEIIFDELYQVVTKETMANAGKPSN